MTLSDRIRQLMAALPSDRSAVTLTRADLASMMEAAGSDAPTATTRDLTVEEVAKEVRRAPSTVRGWLIAGELQGYKLNRRDWRIPRAALRAYLKEQTQQGASDDPNTVEVNIGAWREEATP